MFICNKQKANKCKYYSVCNAPLCPLDKDSLKNGIWYPSDGICRLREFAKSLWIWNQKRIDKKIAVRDGFFTLEMLNKRFRITKTCNGLDSDLDSKTGNELKKWERRFPALRKRMVSRKSLDALGKASYNRF